MELFEYAISWIDSMQYMSGSLAYLAEYFKLPAQKGVFCHSLNSRQNYKLGPKMPPLEVFLEDCHNEEKRRSIEIWYNDRKQSDYYLREELIKYCRKDTEVLLLLITNFLKQWHVLQTKMNMYFMNKAESEERKNQLKEAYFHPFGPSF